MDDKFDQLIELRKTNDSNNRVLDYIIHDLWIENRISSPEVDILCGSIQFVTIDDHIIYLINNIFTLFNERMQRNPYSTRRDFSVNISPNRSLKDGSNVIFQCQLSNSPTRERIIFSDNYISFDELNILQSSDHIENMPQLSGHIEDLLNSKFFNNLNNQRKKLYEYYYSLEYPRIFEQFKTHRITYESLVQDINAQEQTINQLKATYEQLTNEIQEKEEAISRIKNDIDYLSKDKDKSILEFKKELDSLSKDKDMLKSMFESKIEVISYLNPSISEDNNLPLKAMNIEREENLLETLKSHLNYNYREDLLVSFLMALNTNQIITLFGKPGTGKTTFVSQIAKALGARYTIISVQNNWTDQSDLLGYYNPIEKTYESTMFLEAILEANNDYIRCLSENIEPRLHIICLDEMNLARVEYYFASFLSMLQLDPSLQIINLLPKHIQFELKKNIEESSRKDVAKQSYSQDLSRYLDFHFPPNIRFVGTINNDETTNALSPKVIDRSFYLELKPEDISEFKECAIVEQYFPLSLFKTQQEIIGEFKKENARFQSYARQMYGLYKIIKQNGDENDFSDLVILGKVFPIISEKQQFTYDNAKYARTMNIWKTLGSNEFFNYLEGTC